MRNVFKNLCPLLLLLPAICAQSQELSIKGRFVDQGDKSALIGVSIIIINAADTTRKTVTVSDIDGNFQFLRLQEGAYNLRALYLGYRTFETRITLAAQNQDLGDLSMEQASVKLSDIKVEGVQTRAVQKGDTTEYNANAFKTQKDASMQDLIGKMPGVVVENGTIKAHGENVQKVLIDGKEFFGDDATIALRNLPAEIIDKIQVFDRQSDQAQFTGFNDGNTQKTINVVTRPGKNRGQFGKAYAGYGINDRYLAGGNINLFNKTARISLIGLSNNINQQNFSNQDIQSMGGGGSGQGRGGFGGGQGGGRGGQTSNLLTNQQSGINTTHSLGINYSDTWGKNLTFSSSYFFNNSNNITRNVKERIYFLSNDSTQLYNETSDSKANNYNQRFNARVEYKADSFNTIIITPQLAFQNSHSNSFVSGINTFSNNPLNQTNNNNTSNSNGYNFANNALLQHKFSKSGRTISLDVGTSVNNQKGNTALYSLNQYFRSIGDSSHILDQRTQTASNGYTFSTNLTYTEPLGKTGQLQFSYNPAYNKNYSNRETNALDTATQEYSLLNRILSNRFNNTVLTQRGGVSYRLRGEKLNFNIGVNYQNVELLGEQSFPAVLQVNKSFNTPLPNAMLRYNFTKTHGIRIFYRTSTNAPSISQLQNVINNNNPLQLSTGNPDLRQEFTQTLVTRYSNTDVEKGKTLMAFLNASYTANYIGTSTEIATQNRSEEGITLSRGAQITKPVNLDGYWNFSSYFTYGLPVQFIKSNFNLNAGLNYTRTPGLINQQVNTANTYNLNSGFVLGSNISETVDFTVSYSAYYNIVKNTIRPSLNNNYFNHTASIRANWLPWKGLVLSSEFTNTFYNGLGAAFNLNFFLWNPSIGYKFLKNNAAEIRISSFDLLNQNNSISRNITAAYVETNRTEVLRRYFMITFTYNLRKFNGGSSNNNNGLPPRPSRPDGF